MASEKAPALTLGQVRVCVDTRRIVIKAAGIDGQAIVEARHQQLDLCDLFGSFHDSPGMPATADPLFLSVLLVRLVCQHRFRRLGT